MMFKNVNGTNLILGSASPRRKELLSSLQIDFKVVSADIDETPSDGEKPEDMVIRLANMKAMAVAKNYSNDWVLGADTTVVINELILGKPRNSQEARQMLTELSSSKHVVYGGYSLVNLTNNIEVSVVEGTEVTFCNLSADYIDKYLQTKEPDDKAGAYAIQGFGATLVRRIRGSYTNVVGLDIPVVSRMLLEHGVICLD